MYAVVRVFEGANDHQRFRLCSTPSIVCKSKVLQDVETPSVDQVSLTMDGLRRLL
ncbi:hypothetical protein FA10DRAFT_270053 [Acaromyces ingoldii]|uniref:Uncharacterized protein n=1 Tax=Acaromyces ingoldii TaxID=215250 RepID=A0A316YCV3_9BASI|nr:hypothetical protein FA10DRAFT_270041 [Acaromyces ingoldii]XP_025373882.1 hypothetical protein FA10DRAFT_270053 [Acaromyces ingoldii]PWN86669.1 hypothetical protein FA10DRAFT_270041 [Acaromyces ingoldii]PWN86684.1 hypothetical protein FA10DRAFT_270053 [Acaromyces ingoldii]